MIAVKMHSKLMFPSVAAALVIALSFSCSARFDKGVITLNPQITYQTMNGWEATAWSGQLDEADTRMSPAPYVNVSKPLEQYKDKLSDLAVSDLGINRVRLELQCGAENSVDYFGLFIRGQIDYEALRKNRYKGVNDDDDPFNMNPDGFHFTMLDLTIEQVVIPLKQRLEARGESLFVNVCVVCFEPENSLHSSSSEEYGEFVLAAYQHMQSKYGFVPDSWEVMLEPDNNTSWNATQMGHSVVAAARRLQAAKFTPRFLVPSTTNAANAPKWFDQIIAVPGALSYLSEISYHRYRGVSDDVLRQIGHRASQHKLGAAMLEWMGATYQELHQDLKLARNTSWSQYALADKWINETSDNGGVYYHVKVSNNELFLDNRAQFLRQYFKYIRRGAVRIEATTSTDSFDPLAFVNTNGKYVVVVKANFAGSFVINGLPAGTYGIKHTTPKQYNVDAPDVRVTNGQALTAMIPQPGVITIYGRHP